MAAVEKMFMHRDEVCELADVSEAELNKMIKSGKVRASSRSHNEVFLMSDLADIRAEKEKNVLRKKDVPREKKEKK